MFRGMKKIFIEILPLDSRTPPEKWSIQPLFALDKITRLIYSKSISTVRSHNIFPRVSLQRRSWSWKTLITSKDQPPVLHGILRRLSLGSVCHMPCFVSSKCHRTCQENLIFGTWATQISQRKHFSLHLHFVAWHSITRMPILLLVGVTMARCLSSILVKETLRVSLLQSWPLSSKNLITIQFMV